MAKTQAEKQKVTRDGNGNAPVTVVSKADIVAIVSNLDPPLRRPQLQAAKPTFADLPADVQASIEKMCAENNNGQRADSHSRATMTERALSYQATCRHPEVQVFASRMGHATIDDSEKEQGHHIDGLVVHIDDEVTV